MKRLTQKVFFTGLAFIALVSVAQAQTAETDNDKQQVTHTSFVDKDNDGVCDNYEARTTTQRPGQGYGKCNGQRNGKGQFRGKGKGFGKCDGTGKGQGNRQGKRGSQFVDTNNNGVCDNRE